MIVAEGVKFTLFPLIISSQIDGNEYIYSLWETMLKTIFWLVNYIEMNLKRECLNTRDVKK